MGRARQGKLTKLYGLLTDVKKDFLATDFIPDANGTLRFTYGRIRGYEPMDAVYYNPKSIHISRAEASLKKGAQHIFIELQDVGYPGSTYTLMYRPQQDILAGFYFQAAMKQNFEVVFSRAE